MKSEIFHSAKNCGGEGRIPFPAICGEGEFSYFRNLRKFRNFINPQIAAGKEIFPISAICGGEGKISFPANCGNSLP